MKKIISLLLVLCLCFSVIGCQSKEMINEQQTKNSQNQGKSEEVVSEETTQNHYPVTITNYDTTGDKVEQVFEKSPERVVCMETQVAQVMLALGLEEKIVGVAKSVGNVSDKYLDTFNGLELLADDGYPAKEVVINADPDMIAGWGSAFSEKNLGSVNDWIDKGIHTYAMENTVSSKVTGPRTVERIYIDIQNLGKIFNVEGKAEKLIADMKARAKVIDEATSILDDENRVKVLTVQMVYENEFFGRSEKDLTANLIHVAGGISLDKEFGKQSMENIIDLNPDVILIIDRTDSKAEDKIAAFKANSALENVNAIKNNRFVPVKYVDFYGGAYETMEVIEMMAKSFYPKELKDLDISKVKNNVTEYPITITNKEQPSLKNLNAVKNDKFLVIEHTAFY
jgi:iron complex transport system substrate-binding protein